MTSRAAPPAPAALSAPRRVMVVDDNRDFLDSVAELLEELGYEVATARNAAEALECLEQRPVDVALLDVRLPETDGIELLGELQALAPELVCLVVSAFADLDSAIEALHHGAYAYLRKPLNPRDLLAKLDRAFEKLSFERHRRQAERGLRVQHAAARLLATSALAAAAPELLELLAGEYDWQFGALWLVDEQGAALSTQCLWHAPLPGLGRLAELSRRLRLVPDDDLPGRVWSSGEPIECGNLQSWSSERAQTLVQMGLRSAVVRPIVADGEVVGVLELFGAGPREPDGELTELLDGLLPLVGQCVARARAELRLAHQALHDSLTGLPNRVLFLDRLNVGLARKRRRQRTRLAVLFLDLDRFKTINDSLGHEAGDELLELLSGRLRGALRPGDTVARFGGDEFAILCEDLPRRGEAARVAERVRHSLEEPAYIRGREVSVRASVGIAFRQGQLDQRAAAARGRRGHVQGQAPGHGRRVIRGRHARERDERVRDRAAAPACARPWRAAAALPAAGDRGRAAAGGGDRGAGALGALRARAPTPGRVHSPGRGDGPDRADWRVGAHRGLPPALGLASARARRQRADHVGEPLRAPTPAHLACWRPSCTR